MRFAAWALAVAGSALTFAQSPSPHRLRSDIQFLSSDLLEGRGPGTRGDTLAAEYIRAQFSQLGLKPTFQTVPLIGRETQPASRFGPLTWLTDYVGLTDGTQEDISFQLTDIVFAGFGIAAPEFQWDDYGDTAVRGKVVVMLAGEPASDDPAVFGGAARTKYADWNYKFDEARRRGAVAAMIIHTPEAAGFGWDAVRRSWGGEQLRIRRAEPERGLQFAGWVTKAAAAKWLEANVDSMTVEASTPGFRARSLGKRMAARILTKTRTLTTRNVIAVAPGSDEARTGEAILFTAHLDHLGSVARGANDGIYNGAVDNATGLALMLEVARLWMEFDPRPPRTAVFVATAAEEEGSLGAEIYAANPAVPIAATKLGMNLHSYLPLGRTRDFVVDGAERSPLWPLIRHTFERFGVDARITGLAPVGTDAAALARAGVAAFTLKPGADYSAEPARKALFVEDYMTAKSHQPGDEFNEDWDLSGMEQTVSLAVEIALAVADTPATAK